MAREFARSRRVEEQIQRLLSDLIRSQLRDPRVAGVVITEVRASRDLGVADPRELGLLLDRVEIGPD